MSYCNALTHNSTINGLQWKVGLRSSLLSFLAPLLLVKFCFKCHELVWVKNNSPGKTFPKLVCLCHNNIFFNQYSWESYLSPHEGKTTWLGVVKLATAPKPPLSWLSAPRAGLSTLQEKLLALYFQIFKSGLLSFFFSFFFFFHNRSIYNLHPLPSNLCRLLSLKTTSNIMTLKKMCIWKSGLKRIAQKRSIYSGIPRFYYQTTFSEKMCWRYRQRRILKCVIRSIQCISLWTWNTDIILK